MRTFTVRCPECKGTGKDPRQKLGFSVCPTCRGKGTVRRD